MKCSDGASGVATPDGFIDPDRLIPEDQVLDPELDRFLEDGWIRHVVDDLRRQLLDSGPALDQVESIERIASLEKLIATASAVLGAEAVFFAAAERERQAAAGVRARDLGRGTAEQIAFARRVAPASAARHLAFATALAERLPAVAARFREGEISEAQARIVVTRSSHLSDIDAQLIDAAIAPRISGWNLAQTEKAVDHTCYALDPHGSVDRAAHAATERRVWVRPAPDSMAIVSALLPVAQGVAVYAHLRRSAEASIGTGEAGIDPTTDKPRTLGQTMADLLVTRCIGQQSASLVPIEVRVTIGADALLGGDQPADLEHRSPIPAALARSLVAQSESAVWVRRLFTDPISGTAVALDARRRHFPKSLREFVIARDRTCHHPYCSAPVRHIDHIEPHTRGGSTTADNAQALCSRGNLAKDIPGWRSERGRGGVVTVTMPTGHRYTTIPPPQIGLPPITRRE